MNRPNKSPSLIENLEGRTLMTAVALGVSEVADNGGVQLRITGTAGNDQITVKQTSAGLVIGNTGGWTKTITETVNNLWINGEAGNNAITIDASVSTTATIFAGTGKNVVKAGSGNETIVSLGSVSDTLVGGSGFDIFWTDNSAAEKIQNLTSAEVNAGAVHRVGTYVNAAAQVKKVTTVKGKVVATAITIREPAVDAGVSYKSFSSDPIFASTGPSANDIFQGNSGDCYFLSVLSSVARIDPARITSSILDMGDGTVIVALDKNGKQVFVHEDEELPVAVDGSLNYAGLGTQNSTWAALMEKAFCYTRTNTVSYDSIDSGWMDESYEVLGAKPTSTYLENNAAALDALITKDLTAGLSVTYATTPTISNNSALVADHAYTVISATANTIILRNPWVCDANGNGNGYITISTAEALADLTGVVSAAV